MKLIRNVQQINPADLVNSAADLVVISKKREMMHKRMKYVGKLFSVIVGCVMLLLSVVALLDPVGTKMADDNNPFGDPGGPLYPIFLIVISAGLIFWPLALRINKERRSSHGESGQKVQ